MDFEDHLSKLVEYVKKNISKGYPIESLKWALIRQGYSAIEIERAIKRATREIGEKAPKIKEKPKIKYTLFDEEDKEIKVKIKKPFWKKVFEKK